MNTITVIGSINLDTTLRVKQMPKPGETMHTKELFTSGGGKGANQAVAANRSGAKTSFIGAVGNDGTGKIMLEILEKEKINVDAVAMLENQATGQAFIVVDDQGENSIMIHAGANNEFDGNHVSKYKILIKESDFLISQFESAMGSTLAAFEIANKIGVKTILNPAPAVEKIPEELFLATDMIVPNETETEILTGIKVIDENSLNLAAKKFHELGITAVIITLGSKGAFYSYKEKTGIVPAFKVKAVDTTAAGDTFIGAMSSILSTDFENLEEAIIYGNKASSLAVQRFGAQPSIPFKEEIKGESK